MSDQPQPVNMPEPPAKPAQDDSIVINQNVLYYIVIALVFFVAGFITSSTTLGALVKSTVAEAKAEMSVLNTQAISTAVALVPQGSGSVANTVQPTETPVPVQSIDPGDSPSWGPADAKVTIVEYSDFQCPYCEQFQQVTYGLLKQNYGDQVRFVYKHFPLTSIHPEAYPAALASECAREQDKFWEFHDIVYRNQDIMSATQYVNFAKDAGVPNMDQFQQCITTAKYKDRVQADYTSGIQHFVTGTPTFYVNGIQIPGAIGYEQLAAIIEQVKASAS